MTSSAEPAAATIPTVSSVGERALILRLRTRAGRAPAAITVGIGDDAAVLAPARGAHEVLTTDSLVEGVHFRRDWTAPAAIGWKALAVNLSDLAAMGATPRASLLSLALPADFPLPDFDQLIDGFLSLAETSGAHLIGGNLTRSPGPLVIDVTAVGAVRPRRILRRDGGRPGQELYVTGSLGAAAAGLGLLAAGVPRHTMNEAEQECVDRYERPDARTRCGRIVGRSGAATAALDLSDGLADAAWRLAEASGVGVRIDGAALPIHAGARAWAERRDQDPVAFALRGGEDYELLFAVPPRQRRQFLAATRRAPDLAVTCVGTLVTEPGAWLDRGGVLERLGEGYSHF